MELSRRLQAVADMISPNMVVADVGTDHAYIPIYLIQSGKCKHVYAMDINEGPYLKAKEHVANQGLSNQITTRISDGMKGLNLGEVNAIVIAGMGGGLVMKILEQDQRLWPELEEFILQPQSEIHKVREYLLENHFTIVDENIIYEDGKYYPIMKVVKNNDHIGILSNNKLDMKKENENRQDEYCQAELFYGRELIAKKHPILLEFINKEIQVKEEVVSKLIEQIDIQNNKTEMVLLSSPCYTLEVEKKASDTEEKVKALNERIKVLKKELELAYEVQRSM